MSPVVEQKPSVVFRPKAAQLKCLHDGMIIISFSSIFHCSNAGMHVHVATNDPTRWQNVGLGLHVIMVILHCVWDTATYWLKIAYFFHPTIIRRPRSLCSL